MSRSQREVEEWPLAVGPDMSELEVQLDKGGKEVLQKLIRFFTMRSFSVICKIMEESI